MDPLLGQLIGSYRVAEQIGQGGMGRIYLAVQPSIGARVAIKVLSPDRARDVTEIERFFAEARVVNVIRHESIVNVLDLRVLEDGSPAIVMEHLDGAPLSKVIATRGRLPAKEACSIALDVLGALSAAHDKGVVHRDLTPANIFITKGGHVKILDFGIAKLMSRESGTGPTLAGQLIGTPAYVSPEQIRGASDVDGRADLYALGAVLFEALTGKPPFDASSAFDLLRAHEHQRPAFPPELSGEVPSSVSQIVLRALEKDPRMRFANANDMADALKSALGAPDEPVPDTIIPDTAIPDTAIPDTLPADQTGRAPMQSAQPSQPSQSTLQALARSAPTMPPAREKAERTRLALSLVAVAVVAALVAIPLLVRGFVHARAGDLPGKPVLPVDNDVQAVVEPHHFDPSTFLAQATTLAEARAQDLHLVELNIRPVDKHGFMDVANPKRPSEAMYSFRGTKDGAPVVVVVAVTANEVRTSMGDSRIPNAPFPRCTIKEMIATANLPSEHVQITYTTLNPAGTPWKVTAVNGSGTRDLADDCPHARLR